MTCKHWDFGRSAGHAGTWSCRAPRNQQPTALRLIASAVLLAGLTTGLCGCWTTTVTTVPAGPPVARGTRVECQPHQQLAQVSITDQGVQVDVSQGRPCRRVVLQEQAWNQVSRRRIGVATHVVGITLGVVGLIGLRDPGGGGFVVLILGGFSYLPALAASGSRVVALPTTEEVHLGPFQTEESLPLVNVPVALSLQTGLHVGTADSNGRARFADAELLAGHRAPVVYVAGRPVTSKVLLPNRASRPGSAEPSVPPPPRNP